MSRGFLCRAGTFAAGLLLLFLPLGLLGQKAAESPAPPKTLEELQKTVKATLDKYHVPGAGVALVAKDHIIWCGGVGKADLAVNRAVTCDTEFRVGSISKTFVALALLRLQQEGKIKLSSRLADVAPEVAYKNPWEATHPIRIINLLEHTTGFDDMTPSEVYNLRDPNDTPLLNVFQEHPGPQEARWPPSTRMSYSNPGYGIAGYLIEKVTERPYDEYIQQTILAPLGMARADFRLTPANKPFLAQGYHGDPPKPSLYANIYLRPAGDLKASPGELARLVQMFLNRGRIGDQQLLPEEMIARMEVPETTLAARAGLRAGYGLAVYADLSGPVVMYGHSGGIEGFLSDYRYIPEEGVGYVVLINNLSGSALREIAKQAREYLLSNIQKPSPPAIQLTPSDLEKFTGYYEALNPRNQMLAFLNVLLGGKIIFADGGKLYQRGLLETRDLLVPVAANQFPLEKEPMASTIFFSAENGTPATANASGFYGEKSSLAWAYLRLGLIFVALALMASSILFAVIWILRKLLGRMRGVSHFSVRLVPLLAVLSLVLALACFNSVPGAQVGQVNLWTVGVFLGTLLFALFSLWGLVLALRAPADQVHRGVRIHSLLVSLACCGLTAYLAYWHLIGLRLWAP